MRTRRRDREAGMRSTGGFTLVEVMVAIVILATGALALTHLSLSVAVLMRQSSTKTELIALAENEIERVQARDFDNLRSGTDSVFVDVRGKRYVRRTRVSAPSVRTRLIEVDLVSDQDPLGYSTLTWVSSP